MSRNLLKELSEFMRLKLCINAPLLAMSGYLLFNSININLVFVFLSSFFICVGVYAYNNMTDKEEDLINRKKINQFTFGVRGLLIVTISFLLGFIFSLFLSSIISILFCSSFIISGVIYSFFKIKRYTLIKNLYTGFAIPQLFLLGATILTAEIFWYYLIISIFFIGGSLISDMRDYVGDRVAEIKTIPVILGYCTTKKIIYFLLFVLFISILKLNLYGLLVLLPSVILALIFIIRDKYNFAFFYGGLPFILLTTLLILSRIFYG